MQIIVWVAIETFQGPDYSPPFPDEHGGTVSRSAFVSHIEAGFRILCVDTVSHTGSCLVGEHIQKWDSAIPREPAD